MPGEQVEKSEGRFDFSAGVEVGTTKELLVEINNEIKRSSFEEITFKSLKPTLAFIEDITGVAIKNSDEPLPLVVLKVIKLLFTANEKSSIHLFRLLQRPEAGKKPTMEFCTGTTIPRDEKAVEGARIINEITAALAKEISEDKIQLLKRMLGDKETQSTAEKFQRHIERASLTAEEIFEIRFHGENFRVANALGELAYRIASMSLSGGNVSTALIHETIYIHLETLALQHFILHHPQRIREVRIKGSIGSIDQSVWSLCEKLSEAKGEHIEPNDEVVPLAKCDALVMMYLEDFISLVKHATGCTTRKDRFVENIRRAKAILVSSVLRRPDDDRADADRLKGACVSVLDMVAALCSFRYQQEQKGSKYHAYWIGQGSAGESPQRMFDEGLRKHDPHQHQGVFQLYYYRFEEYRASFMKTSESHAAWMGFQARRFDSYLMALRARSIVALWASASALDYQCIEHAHHIALQHHERCLPRLGG